MDEWTSIDKLPCLNTLCFWVILEELFFRLISPELWGQARADLITSSSKRAMSEEIVPVAILITNEVGKGSLGMVTIFCHSDQAKVDPSVTLLTLVQWDLPELAMVVMIYSSTHPISHGGLLASPSWMKQPSQQAPQLKDFHFPGCAYISYFYTPLLRLSCLRRKREIG